MPAQVAGPLLRLHAVWLDGAKELDGAQAMRSTASTCTTRMATCPTLGPRCERHGLSKDQKLFVAFVRLGDVNFTVLNYAGDLLGGMRHGRRKGVRPCFRSALAFNDRGLGFSLNWVGPGSCVEGLGRNFVSRQLLEARGWLTP